MRKGFPTPVFWVLVVLFLLAAASVYWFGLYIRDVWIGEHLLVADRFDSAASVRITTACFASLAFTPGVLFAHYKRADTYGSPLELFFGVVFALSLAMAVIGLLPALLA
jgi:hypothetical protein